MDDELFEFGAIKQNYHFEDLRRNITKLLTIYKKEYLINAVHWVLEETEKKDDADTDDVDNIPTFKKGRGRPKKT